MPSNVYMLIYKERGGELSYDFTLAQFFNYVNLFPHLGFFHHLVLWFSLIFLEEIIRATGVRPTGYYICFNVGFFLSSPICFRLIQDYSLRPRSENHLFPVGLLNL
jgi:hypothetical protein